MRYAVKHERFRLPYHRHRERVAAAVLQYLADFFAMPVAQLNEETRLEDLKRDDHEIIRLMLHVEDYFKFEFRDDLRTPKGKLKACRADTLRRIGELITFVARLPGNTPKAEQDGEL